MKDTSFRHRRPEPWFNDDPIAQPMDIQEWKKWWHPVLVIGLPFLVGLGLVAWLGSRHPVKVLPVKSGHSVSR